MPSQREAVLKSNVKHILIKTTMFDYIYFIKLFPFVVPDSQASTLSRLTQKK